MTTKHTPTPWKAAKSPCIYKGRENEWEIHWSDDGECVAEVVHGEDDAKFIVRACNMHVELVAVRAAMLGVLHYALQKFDLPNELAQIFRETIEQVEARGEA